MANIKAMKKDLKRNAKARVVNTSVKSALKTYIKKVRTSVAQHNPEKAAEAMTQVASSLDKATARGIIHKNQAARRKSRAAKAANKVVAAVEGAPKVEEKKAAPTKKAAAKPAAKKTSAKK